MDESLLLSPLLLQHAPLLNPVLPVRIEDNEFTKQLSGEARKEATINVMCHVLQAKLGGARNAILFDDVHNMDTSSWQLLAAVRQRVKSILFVLATRPWPKDTAPQELSAILSEAHSNEKLSELARQDIDELMRAYMGVSGRVDVPLSTAITSKSGGNPFFAKGFIQSIVEQGLLDTSHDQIALRKGLDIAKVKSSQKHAHCK